MARLSDGGRAMAIRRSRRLDRENRSSVGMNGEEPVIIGATFWFS